MSTKSRNKADALKFISDLKRMMAAAPKPEYVTLNKFRYEYQGYIEKTRSPQYLRSVKLSFKKLVESLGDIPLASLKVRDFEKFFMSVYQQANYAAHLYHRTLKAAFNKAVEWGYLTENPIRKIKLPRIPKTLPVFITKSDLDKIMANTKNPSLRDLFFFGFHTGMRQNEITNLQWDAVNFKDNVIKVQITDSFMTKSRRERIIPINNSLLELLVKLHSKSSSKYVFTNPCGYKYHNDYISHQFKKAVRAAGLDDRIHFHDLRHGFASSLVQQGVSLYVVRDLLGHENHETTQIYSHLKNQNLIEAVLKLD
jgi:integrase